MLGVKEKISMIRRASVLAVAACFSGGGMANPSAPLVVNGQVTFATQGKTLTVTNSPGAIINWGGFSIRADEATRFVQQSAASSVLNRVVGQDPSVILGNLQSNGRVFLINPSGILFGAGAQIDVAGLVASSLNISDADFTAGRLKFRGTGKEGSVVNQGEIRTPAGGQVFLIAPRVENGGLITTPSGDIVLAAGRSVEIVDLQHPSIRIQIDAPDNEALNVGSLVAKGGRIGVYGGLIRNSGRVNADAVVVEDGKVFLRSSVAQATRDENQRAGTVRLQASTELAIESGSRISADGPEAGLIELLSGGDLSLKADSHVSANGVAGGSVLAQANTGALLAQGIVEAKGSDDRGGSVRMLGERVAILSRSRIDASGAKGGGEVLIGGDFQGKNAEVQNAKRTYVGPEAEIRADAVSEGDGGKVIVWADESTQFHGAISAHAGAERGDGGTVEISGKQALQFHGRVDVSAASGRGGSILFDPANITLSTGADTNTAGFTAGSDIQELFADDSTLNSIFNVGAGGSFNGIATGSNIILQATTNITVSNNFDLQTATGNSGVSLTLQANSNIAVNANVTTNGAGTLTLIADADANGTGSITRGAVGNTLTQAAGTLTLSAAQGITATVQSPILNLSNRTNGAISVTTNGAIVQSAPIVSSTTAAFTAGAANDITLTNASNNFASVSVVSANNATIRDVNAVALGTSTV
ncbi:MAG TPA: filamentous hemagglutinin N-terminal domain-containing protein, partial [Opitutaceae bacterium]|nr:filamentous hemagglutinin N-terminal domain-containing protein [Opitutaceae bacterium]